MTPMRTHLHSLGQTAVRCGQQLGICFGIIAFALNAEPLSAASPAPAETSIKVTTETKAQADAILRALFNLEKQQSNKNTVAVEELRAKLVKAASGSPFVELPEWRAYTSAWEALLAAREKEIRQTATTNSNQNDSITSNIGGSVEVRPTGAQGSVNASRNRNSVTNQSSSSTTQTTGGMGDSGVRKQKGESLNALLSKIRQLGFRELVNQKELEGFWTWSWSGGPSIGPASVLLELQPDGKLLARIEPPANKWPNFSAQSVWGGTWSVSEGKLSAQITGYWAGWKRFIPAEDAPRHQPFPAQLLGEIIPKRTITFGNQDRMILDGERDNTMERVNRERSLLSLPVDGKIL